MGGSGLKVSHLALGTMTWGVETDADEAAAQLVAFHDAGGTLVDTAASYGYGETEELIGGLLADVVPRANLQIATKAGIARTPEGTRRRLLARRAAAPVGRLAAQARHRLRRPLVRALRRRDRARSTRRSGALDAAVSSGKVRYAGVSNYSGWRIGQAAAWQRAVPGRAPIVANQVQWSLVDRGVEREVVPGCLALGVGLFPWSPLGGGVLTGKYRGGVPSDSRVAVGHRPDLVASDARTSGIVEAVATAAEGLATAPVAVALAWIRDRPGVTAPVLGARTLGQLTAALACETLELPAEISAALDDVSAPALSYPEQL